MATGSSEAAPSFASLCEDDLWALYKALYPARNNYKKLGLQIGVKMSEIESVERKENDTSDRLLEILKIRLRKGDPLTWNDIDAALREECVGEVSTANAIKNKYGHLYNIFGSPDDISVDGHRKGMKFEKETTKHYKSEERRGEDVKQEKKRHKQEEIYYYATSGGEKVREEEESLQTKQQFERKGYCAEEKEKYYEKQQSKREPVHKRQGKKVARYVGGEVHSKVQSSKKHKSHSSSGNESKAHSVITTELECETSSEDYPQYLRGMKEKNQLMM